MGYCKKCGTELQEGINFCGKCGSPVEKLSKQKSGKKKWGIIISFGVIILAIASVGVLLATGVIGKKGNVVQTIFGSNVVPETSVITEYTVKSADILKEAAKTIEKNAEDMAWEAFEAYKSYIEEEMEIYNENDVDNESLFDNCKYMFTYVDNDNYPELFVNKMWAMSLYTYKDGSVVRYDDFFSSGGDVGLSYCERSGYMYLISGGSDWTLETMFKLEGVNLKTIYYNLVERGDGKELLGEEKIIEQKGIEEVIWTAERIYYTEPLWEKTINAAYKKWLSQNS